MSDNDDDYEELVQPGDITDDMIVRATKQRPGRGERFETFLNRLTHLNLQKRGVRRICNLHGCGKLRVLYLYDNRILRIENLSFARGLVQLYLQNNQIERMEGLESLVNLEKLFLDNNCISVVEGLHRCSRLEELHLPNQNPPDGSVLAFDPSSMEAIAPSLSVLNISGTHLQHLSPVAQLDRLSTLKAADNQISSFDEVGAVLMACIGLSELDLRRNPIAEAQGYRDAVIVNSEVLDEIDGKPVKPNQRDFLRRREARRYQQRRAEEKRAAAAAAAAAEGREHGNATAVRTNPTKENTRMATGHTNRGPRGSYIKSKPGGARRGGGAARRAAPLGIGMAGSGMGAPGSFF